MKKPVFNTIIVIYVLMTIVMICWLISGSGTVSQAAEPHDEATSSLTDSLGKPNYFAINQTIDAMDTRLPKPIVKAVAWAESGWHQFNNHGHPLYYVNIKSKARHATSETHLSRDWGLMQINDQTFFLDPNHWSFDKIQSDPLINLKAGVTILEKKQAYVNRLKRKKQWPALQQRYHLTNRDDLAITLKAYNGFQRSWHYVDRVLAFAQSKPWEQAMKRQWQTETGLIYPVKLVGILNLADNPVPIHSSEHLLVARRHLTKINDLVDTTQITLLIKKQGDSNLISGQRMN